MKKLLILSGKGGTGKTTVTASFIRFAGAKAFADCDVDAPNLHLVMKKTAEPVRMDYYGSHKAFIDPQRCASCGLCTEHCRFEAIRKEGSGYVIDEYACEGCGVCQFVCPQKAVSMQKDKAGRIELYLGETVFSTAELKMGRGNSGKLVSEVKKTMMQAAPEAEIAIIDGSPGIGCPVIASVSGVDMVLVVAEPSCAGLSDLMRLLNTTRLFETKVAVCVNKYDVCMEQAEAIRCFCEEMGVPFVGFLPYDRKASEAINAGKSVADVGCPLHEALKGTFEAVMKLLEEKM